jgi:hypothetical protein
MATPTALSEPPNTKTGPSKTAPNEPRPFERRREPRYPTNDPVEVCILEPRYERVSGTVLDISRSGVRVQVRTPVAKTVHLEIILASRAIIFGETRYCRRHGDAYHLGVSIDDVYFAQDLFALHIEPDLIGLYLDGTGLTALQAIQIRNHLVNCSACRENLAARVALSSL